MNQEKRCLHCNRKLEKTQKKFCSIKCKTNKFRKDKFKESLKDKGFLDIITIRLAHYGDSIDSFSIYLMLGLFILLIICFIYLYFIVFNASLISKGFDFSHYHNIFSFITYLFGGVFALKVYIMFFTRRRYQRIYSFLKCKINNYVLITFYLIFLLIFIGVDVIGSEYSADLSSPLKFEVQDNFKELIGENILSIDTNICESSSKYIKFVKGDTLKCKINFSYKNQSQFKLSNIKIMKNNLKGELNAQSEYNYSSDKIVYDYFIYLTNESYQHYIIDIWFSDNSNENKLFSRGGLETTLISEEDYNYMQKQKLPLILALLTVAVFSVIAAMRNLRDIIEKKYDN